MLTDGQPSGGRPENIMLTPHIGGGGINRLASCDVSAALQRRARMQNRKKASRVTLLLLKVGAYGYKKLLRKL